MIYRFWEPSLTSQYSICPVPFHYDTYRGCVYGCVYCFARDFTEFSRRNSPNKSFKYLEANRPDLFQKWVEKALNSPTDYKKGNIVAFKERIPLKIGATSDPFPWIEKTEKVTYRFLEILDVIDYPCEIQTKNPAVLAEYAKNFENPNWAIAVTIITSDEKFAKVCEPNVPSPKDRFSAIKKLTDDGYKVMVKIQPAIYPKIIDDLPQLVKDIKDSGAWAFNTEGLKIRISMPKAEQAEMQKIGDYMQFNIREFYKSEARTTSDYELSSKKKWEYVKLADELAKKHNVKYFSADNDMFNVGAGCECCGTEVLRNYKLYLNNIRGRAFPNTPNASTELGKCFCNFGRSLKNVNKTLDEVMAETFANEKKLEKQESIDEFFK